MAKSHLWDDAADSEEAAGSLSINAAFAEKYKTKKEVEELSKLKDKYGSEGSEDEDSENLSTDDSDGEFVTPSVDAAILSTLAAIKRRDPSVYQADKQVFDEEEARLSAVAASKQAGKKGKKDKPVLLRDFQRQRLLDERNGEPAAQSGVMTFEAESAALKSEASRAFHAAADGESDDEDDFLQVKDKSSTEREKEAAEYQLFLKTHVGEKTVEAALDTEEAFLRDFILNRQWVERPAEERKARAMKALKDAEVKKPKLKELKGKHAAAAAEKDESSEADDEKEPAMEEDDSDFDEKADEFETAYNFRFEQPGASTITTFPRAAGASTSSAFGAAPSVRKVDTKVSARQRAREREKEKKDAEKAERTEEIRRMRALKRKEVEDKLRRIIEAGGVQLPADKDEDKEVDDWVGDGDWDEEKHEKLMKSLYGAEYEQADEEAGWKPQWDDDIEIDDLVGDDWDSDAAGGLSDEEGVEPVASTSAAVEAEPAKKKKKDKKKGKDDSKAIFDPSLVSAALSAAPASASALLSKASEAYDALDYTSTTGGVRTRFSYMPVRPESFELTAEEILLATDKELNEYVGLKKLAPFKRESEGEKARLKKKKLKALREKLSGRRWGQEHQDGEEGVTSGKRSRKGDGDERPEKRARRTEGAEGDKPKKRRGKKERMRLQKAAEAE